MFRIDSPREAFVILDGKKYTQNENSGSYLFDPFFNILKFEIKRKDGKPHSESFKVVESNELTFRYSQNNDSEFWLDNKVFASDESIEDFVDYIVKKEGGDEKIKHECLRSLRDANEITTVSDLLKITDKK